MDEMTAVGNLILHICAGVLLLTSYTYGEFHADSAHVPPTITLADWPLHQQLPASFLATVDKVVISSFNPIQPESHALLVTESGRVYLYGKSRHLGFGKKKQATLRELEEFRWRPIRDAVFGKQDARFLFILTEEGEIWSMGDNSVGQLGRMIRSGTLGDYEPAEPSSRGEFARIEELTSIVEICAGAQHGLARDEQGRVFKWGYVLQEEGIQPPTQIFPEDRSVDNKVIRISCGLKHCALLTHDRQIYSLGYNDHGQLGIGTKDSNPKPSLIPWQPEDGQIEQLTCGSSHMAVLTSAGKAYLWGANGHGQLGLGRETGWTANSRNIQTTGSTSDKTKPTELIVGSFDMIMASGQTTLGCTNEGQLYVWGQFRGRNEIVPFYSPVPCNRHRDLLCQGETDGMVTADTHVYHSHVRDMIAESEAGIMKDLASRNKGLKMELIEFLGGMSGKYNETDIIDKLEKFLGVMLKTYDVVTILNRMESNHQRLQQELTANGENVLTAELWKVELWNWLYMVTMLAIVVVSSRYLLKHYDLKELNFQYGQLKSEYAKLNSQVAELNPQYEELRRDHDEKVNEIRKELNKLRAKK